MSDEIITQSDTASQKRKSRRNLESSGDDMHDSAEDRSSDNGASDNPKASPASQTGSRGFVSPSLSGWRRIKGLICDGLIRWEAEANVCNGSEGAAGDLICNTTAGFDLILIDRAQPLRQNRRDLKVHRDHLVFSIRSERGRVRVRANCSEMWLVSRYNTTSPCTAGHSVAEQKRSVVGTKWAPDATTVLSSEEARPSSIARLRG